MGGGALDGDLRRADDRRRACAVDRGRDLATLRRPGSVDGISRHWRHERAVLRLCQPLVRPPPRLGARADLERELLGRRHLAADLRARDRKSTRLNSSHLGISYAVFCLKKKTGQAKSDAQTALRLDRPEPLSRRWI